MLEYLVHLAVTRTGPDDDAAQAAADPSEATYVAKLFAEGKLRRLWRDPGQKASWMLLYVDSPEELHTILSGLPYFRWLQIQVHSLSKHPSEPPQIH